MENTDKSLIDAHCRGEREAFGQVVRRYGGSLLGYLTKMSGSRELAEDLFQETFKRVHEKAHTFRGGRLGPWLFKIATRVALNGLQRRRRLRVVSLDQQLDCAEGRNKESGAAAVADNSCEPSEEVIRAEQKEQVRQAIELLPEKQRAALVLAYYQQLSYREVAEVLGCSIGTVKTQMYRALRTLAQKLPDVSGETK
ncbi:MAG TPA: sigma-70 family RNA polymerase sigma factor [Sedimentisphaerales bacterium]|nr:sigma-70 family RNA polymerase sigma factor [Sedimentisphaerales bacterium]